VARDGHGKTPLLCAWEKQDASLDALYVLLSKKNQLKA
jgi:hypothetical protein